jgi:hypothetical protein
MRINPYLYGVFVLVIFLGVILGLQAAGIWSVSGKVTGGGDAVQPSAGDVNTIKGWMTLEQIVTAYNVPLVDLLAQFNLPADTPISTAIKDLESDTFSVTELRAWLVSRQGPVEPGATAAPVQPATATPIVLPTEGVAAPLPTEHVALEKTITGKTTFQELLDWGVPEDAIRQVIGVDLPALSTVIKDYVTQQGTEFSSVKSALQIEVDKTK